MLILLLICTMASILASSAAKNTKDITIDTGTIRGVDETLSNGLVVRKYLGIPYAQAERFEKPVDVTPWKGVKKCESFGPVCYQMEFAGPFGFALPDMSEDCLNLNVYVPPSDGSKNKSKPVMFWIHGGSFIIGSNRNTNGSYLAGLGKVIVITINYRLMSFGFLSDRTSNFTGNYGLYDQLAALQWVKRNIAKFGGDPNRVTIFGNSLGGVSVSLLSLSPLAKGLFKYSIIQSGSSLTAMYSVAPGVYQDGLLKKELSTMFNCTSYKSAKSCLKSIDATNLTSLFLSVPSIPVVDGEIITDDPRKLLQSGNFSQESTLMGVAMSDGSCFTNAIPELSYGPINTTGNGSHLDLKYYSDEIKLLWDYMFMSYKTQFPVKFNKSSGILSSKIEHEYLDLKNKTKLRKRIRTALINFPTDAFFAAPAIAEANYYANKSGKVFFYQVEYGLRVPEYFKHPTYLNNGYHETEKFMVFGVPLKDKKSWKTNDGLISREVIKMWSNFAKTGNPNTPQALDVKWPQYHVDTQQYMSIKPNMTVNNKLRPQKMKFWNQVIPSFFQKNTTKKDSSDFTLSSDTDFTKQIVII